MASFHMTREKLSSHISSWLGNRGINDLAFVWAIERVEPVTRCRNMRVDPEAFRFHISSSRLRYKILQTSALK